MTLDILVSTHFQESVQLHPEMVQLLDADGQQIP